MVRFKNQITVLFYYIIVIILHKEDWSSSILEVIFGNILVNAISRT